MTWPQGVVAAWLIVGVISAFRAAYADTTLSSRGVVAMWFWSGGCAVLIAAALSVGGFW